MVNRSVINSNAIKGARVMGVRVSSVISNMVNEVAL
jgi:hypothetical protein